MKNLLKSILAVTAAAMAFVGCEKEQSLASQNNEETKTLKLVVDNQPMNQTKTQMNQAGTDVIWSNQEKVNFYADSKYLHSSDVTASVVNDKLEAKLTVPTAIKEIDGFFGASYNRNTEVKDKNTDFVSAFGISLPEMQSITVNTFDPLADALVMETKDVSGSDLTQPVTGIVYHRLHAITKLSFKGLENYVTDQVVSVEFSTQNADLAGNFTYDFKTRKFVDNTTGAEKAGSIFTESPSKSVVMTLPENTLLDANFAAWMVSAAQTLKAGEVVTVTINTDKHRITGSFKLPADKTFVNTQLNALTLNMSKATVTPVKAVDIKPGDYVILYKDSKNAYQALSSNTSRYNVAAAPVQYNGTDAEFTTADSGIIFTISKDANGDYAFQNKSNQKYLIQKDAHKGHINSAFEVNAQYFEIFANNGKYGIRKNGHILNLTSNSDFSFETAENQALTECLILPLKKAPILTFDVQNFSVSATATSLNIPFKRNEYVTGDVTVSVTSGADWLTVNPDRIANPIAEISCSFAANTGAERTATLKVSYNGLPDQTIKVAQAAVGSPDTVPVGTVLWEEDWTGCSANEQPQTATKNNAIKYSYGPSNSKIYNDNLSKGQAPELLVAKKNGFFTASGINVVNVGKVKLSYLTNKSLSVSCTIDGQPLKFGNTNEVVIPQGAQSMTITFNNTSSKNNARLDDIKLIVAQ